MTRSGATYWPVSFVTVLRVWPVSVLITVIAAVVTTDPEGSVTVPTMVASWPNAWNEKPRRNRQRTARRRLELLTARATLLAQSNQGEFISTLRWCIRFFCSLTLTTPQQQLV